MTKLKLRIKYLCSTPEKRQEGLMKKSILNDQCAFFIFPQKGCHAFWNKDVACDLSLAFINEKFEIVDFLDLEAASEEVKYPGNREIKYVIEANKGIFERNDVRKGDYIDFDPDKLLVIIKEGI
jgi:uncharacterized membrane protein (UPF0127 family)